ncbi:hypothetical protein D3C79_887430 [compost metagenome]
MVWEVESITPRAFTQKWVALMLMATSLVPSRVCSASRICWVSRSCTWGRRAKNCTMRLIFDSPITLPRGI